MSRHAPLGYAILLLAWSSMAGAQPPLPGEFTDIQLGRPFVGRDRFPSLAELRAAVNDPRITAVALLELHASEDNHHLPVWSPDGVRLACQRTNVGASSSRIVLFDRLSQSEPRLVPAEGPAYDYMFRWGLNSESSFVFVRLEEAAKRSRIVFSPDGQQLEPIGQLGDSVTLPTLYERTDGVHWIAFERQGDIVQSAWSDGQQQQRKLSRGTSPRWSRDAKRLLFARDRSLPGNLASYEPAERILSSETEAGIEVSNGAVVRAPTYSPDEQLVAWFEADPGQRSTWRIQVGKLGGRGDTLAAEVVVNADFKSEGPSWEPSSRRIWYFSQAQRAQQYFPLAAVDVGTGQVLTVAYSQTLTNPADVAVNPATRIPEIAFVARQGATQNLFVIFLNHF